MNPIYNTEQIDTTKQPMFFGEPLSVQRYDRFKYPVFDELTDKQLSFFWRPQEVNLGKDISDYLTLTEDEKFIFFENLKYQTLLDSIQGRAPSRVLGPVCSLPELESCIETWTFFETIHSRSYTYIIKNLVTDPSIIFDDILLNENIRKRASSICKYYDKFIESTELYYSGQYKKYDLYRDLYLLLITINALEGLRFFVSFICSFTFAVNKKMEGSASILSLIANDEQLHVAITQNIINFYRRTEKDNLMLEVINNNQDSAINIYKEVVEEEKEWANHLFNNRGMLGLSAQLLHQYIDYIANLRMNAIGLPEVFEAVKSNPFAHLNSFFNPHSLQKAPQEAQLTSYLVGGIKQDINDNLFADFKL